MSDSKHKPWCSEQARKQYGVCICQPAESELASATLLACPFCGGDAMRVENPADYVFRVVCRNCVSAGPFAHTENLASEKWNTRQANIVLGDSKSD
jgi:Lar family restriction alleviation protein